MRSPSWSSLALRFVHIITLSAVQGLRHQPVFYHHHPKPWPLRRFLSTVLPAINPRHQPIVYHPKLSPLEWPSRHTFPMSKFRETLSYLTTHHIDSLQGPLVLSPSNLHLVPNASNPIPLIKGEEQRSDEKLIMILISEEGARRSTKTKWATDVRCYAATYEAIPQTAASNEA